ncbi:uncharacterized protein APUU_41453S [Aspergillus puulaauensis]|uniref:GPR1/FUN34/yaaH family-domain-containing protein n=1 Tax=Aspergillus puulaauensis TaxID=1220207 RepID=A0A7R7XPH3_9EURO|nr:uncharacterized protein APUU_41453S [Aspergillus puulaauensis]BCS25009.1 hypothetical protein APUU_41453S [Aspergillus puulaauensis]
MEPRQKSDISHLSRYETNASIMIPKDVFEKMYLTPQLPVKGQLRKTLGNPTPMALLGFLLSTTSFGCVAMGWRGAEIGNSLIGVYYFFGGTLQVLGAIFELIIGNTFPSVVFSTFEQYGLANSGDPASFYSSFGFFLCFLGVLCFMFLVCSLRTNIVFVFIFVFLEAGVLLLAASYWYLAQGLQEAALRLEKAGGACVFVFSVAGWYLLFSIMLQSVDFPISLPVGDLSTRFEGKSAREKRAAEIEV